MAAGLVCLMILQDTPAIPYQLTGPPSPGRLAVRNRKKKKKKKKAFGPPALLVVGLRTETLSRKT